MLCGRLGAGLSGFGVLVLGSGDAREVERAGGAAGVPRSSRGRLIAINEGADSPVLRIARICGWA
jgi:hypothetical protein